MNGGLRYDPTRGQSFIKKSMLVKIAAVFIVLAAWSLLQATFTTHLGFLSFLVLPPLALGVWLRL